MTLALAIARERKIAREEGMTKGMAKGMAKGRAEGMAKGRAKGMAKGRAKGRAEGMAKGMAKGMLKTLSALVQKKLLTLTEAAKQANMTVEDFAKAVKAL